MEEQEEGVREAEEDTEDDDDDREVLEVDGEAYSLERSLRAYGWLSGRTNANCELLALTANINFCRPAAAASSWFGVSIACCPPPAPFSMANCC